MTPCDQKRWALVVICFVLVVILVILTCSEREGLAVGAVLAAGAGGAAGGAPENFSGGAAFYEDTGGHGAHGMHASAHAARDLVPYAHRHLGYNVADDRYEREVYTGSGSDSACVHSGPHAAHAAHGNAASHAAHAGRGDAGWAGAIECPQCGSEEACECRTGSTAALGALASEMGGGDEAMIENALSRNDNCRAIAGSMNRQRMVAHYFEEELAAAEDSQWWGRNDY